MSHIKNVQALGKLMGICTGYGGKYKPGNGNLQVNALTTLTNNARQSIGEVHSAQTDFDNASNLREMQFGDMKRFCTRILSALRSSGAGKLTIQDAQASVRKLGGKKPADRLPVASEAAATPKLKIRMARGLDYVSMADHFAKLVETVSSVTDYQPNEPELTVAGLTEKLTSLQRMNEAVNVAAAQLNNARKKRNALLYGDAVNVVVTGKAVKEYIRSAFGPSSEQYMEVKKVHFTKPLA